jgi:hypothetical protein
MPSPRERVWPKAAGAGCRRPRRAPASDGRPAGAAAVRVLSVARRLTTRMAGTVGPVGASSTSSNLVHRPELLDSGRRW